MTDDIAARLAGVQARIDGAAVAAGRDPRSVTLIAVSKTFGVDAIAAARAAGQTVFGENRAQELKTKAAVAGAGLSWHFIGPLQTNKVRLVVGVAELIHSVDRFGLAEAIGRRAGALGLVQRVLIEVNIAGEPSKHGVEPPAAPALALRAAQVPGVEVAGVMAIPPAGSAAEARAYLRAVRDVGAEVAAAVPGATELSMGMTDDLEPAVEEGATLVRVGRGIFGPRRSP